MVDSLLNLKIGQTVLENCIYAKFKLSQSNKICLKKAYNIVKKFNFTSFF